MAWVFMYMLSTWWTFIFNPFAKKGLTTFGARCTNASKEVHAAYEPQFERICK